MGETLQRLEGRTIAVVRADTAEDAAWIAHCLAKAGVAAIELTWTVPDAVALLATLRRTLPGSPLLGMGTVLDEARCRRSIEAGADFLASPVADPVCLAMAREADRLFLPGVATPTELWAARQFGAEAFKVFPCGPLGGAAYLKALRGPFPDWPLIPFGGLRPEDVGPCLAAGAWAVGLGDCLMPRADWLATHDASRYRAWLARTLDGTTA